MRLVAAGTERSPEPVVKGPVPGTRFRNEGPRSFGHDRPIPHGARSERSAESRPLLHAGTRVSMCGRERQRVATGRRSVWKKPQLRRGERRRQGDGRGGRALGRPGPVTIGPWTGRRENHRAHRGGIRRRSREVFHGRGADGMGAAPGTGWDRLTGHPPTQAWPDSSEDGEMEI